MSAPGCVCVGGGHDQWGRCEEPQIRIHRASVPGDLRQVRPPSYQALGEDEQPDRDGEREILVLQQVPHDEVGVPQEAEENPAGPPFDDEDV